MIHQAQAVSTAEFWQNRYQQGYTGWDIGQVSPPLQTYFDQLTNKSATILIPGAGNAHEAEYLHEKGFEQVIVVDFAQLPLDNFTKKFPNFPKKHLVKSDFFTLNPENYQFDLIIEQTFFCAIDPNRREEYAQQMQRLLKPSGKLVGLLFDREFNNYPPFGGSLAEYQALFVKYFNIHILETCYNSIKPRQGNELFMIMTAKNN